MFSKRILITLCFCLLVLPSISAAQDPPPVAKKPGPPTKTMELPSLREVTETKRFSSTEWLFSIGLPKDISGYGPITPKDTGVNVAGGYFNWVLREGNVFISCVNHLDPTFSLKTENDYADFFKGGSEVFLARAKATFVSGVQTELAGMKGYKFRFQMPTGEAGIGRMYYKDKRSCSLLAVASKDLGGAELMLTIALDSFSPIDKTKVDNDILRSVEASTPSALPQEPVAKKEKTDAEDENLKGNVKTVASESEDQSGTWSVQGRHFDSVADYDRLGNLVKRISYDSKGKPFEVTVYGYIDNARVSKSKMIRYEYDPPAVFSGGPPNGVAIQMKPATQKPDPRYQYRYEYKYADGKRTEEQFFFNDGVPYLRYVYKYDWLQREELVYDEEGKLNQRYLSKFDSKGNEIERIDADALHQNGERKYTLEYESFDDHGNWTKKTTFMLVNEGGKELSKPWYISYRSISYY